MTETLIDGFCTADEMPKALRGRNARSLWCDLFDDLILSGHRFAFKDYEDKDKLHTAHNNARFHASRHYSGEIKVYMRGNRIYVENLSARVM